MAITSKQRAKQLEEILNSVERSNKQDALDYTRGHLNEANLHKPTEFRSHKSWKGSEYGKDLLTTKDKPSRLPKPVQGRKNDKMKDTLTQFTLGTDGFLPTVKPPKRKSKRRDDWPSEISGSVDEQALIEEIDSRRFMLNRSQPARMNRKWAVEDENDNPREAESKSVPPMRHGFYSLNSGATKRDQFHDFQTFEHNTLRKQDILDRSLLSGDQAAAKLEQKLNRKLMILGHSSQALYHRLQAHSDTLQELIEASPLFGHILKQIKAEFDDYMEWLLDTKPTESHVLRSQIDDLYDKRVSNPKQMSHVKRDLNRLEEEGRKLLEQNDQLREELRKEQQAVQHGIPTDYYSRRQTVDGDERGQFDLADQLQDLHATVLEKLDKLEAMRAEMRRDYVPSSVCQNLEQCLKDTEVEVQKLLQQNEIMSKDIEEMEDGIGKAVDESDVSGRDKAKCWEKVNRTHVTGIKRSFKTYEEYSEFISENSDELSTNLRHPYLDGESSDDEDENQSTKWNWYIS